jgi:hypothetical protein
VLEQALAAKPVSKESPEVRQARELQEKHDAEQFRRAELERLKAAAAERSAQDAAIAERLRQAQVAAAAPAAGAGAKPKPGKKKRWF